MKRSTHPRWLVLGMLAAMTVLGCRGGSSDSTSKASTVAPMMSDVGISVSLAQNYGFWQITLVMGDYRAFGSNYAEGATMSAPGYGRIVGRDSIVARFGGEGRRLGISEVRRVSQGFRIEGREVADSGTYEILTTRPLPANALDAKGRYWTRWSFTDDARWLILSDSLAGVVR